MEPDFARSTPYLNRQQGNPSTFVLTSPSTHLASLLVDHLRPEAYGSYNLESLSGHYLTLIPPRIGHTAVLDSAVRCICTSHSMFLKHIKEDKHVMRRLYLEAIGHLKETLQRPLAAVTPEILCVTMLLRLFEVSAATLVTLHC